MYGPKYIAKPLAFSADTSPCWKGSKIHEANIRGGENPFTSSLHVWREACRRNGWGRTAFPPSPPPIYRLSCKNQQYRNPTLVKVKTLKVSKKYTTGSDERLASTMTMVDLIIFVMVLRATPEVRIYLRV
jgi:hypothetical protein